jgi:hypothetical protein
MRAKFRLHPKVKYGAHQTDLYESHVFRATVEYRVYRMLPKSVNESITQGTNSLSSLRKV